MVRARVKEGGVLIGYIEMEMGFEPPSRCLVSFTGERAEKLRSCFWEHFQVSQVQVQGSAGGEDAQGTVAETFGRGTIEWWQERIFHLPVGLYGFTVEKVD